MGWWKTAEVGDKIVCVDDKPINWLIFPLMKGRVYTVKRIARGRFLVGPNQYGVRTGVWIVEDNGARTAYRPSRFRPVQKKSTEAAVAALRPLSAGEKVAKRQLQPNTQKCSDTSLLPERCSATE